MNIEQVLTAANGLVAYLRSFDDQDRERGLEAAEIIERTLRLFSQQYENAVSRLRYDVGGKGLLDWRWSDEHREKLESFSHEVFVLLQTSADSGRR